MTPPAWYVDALAEALYEATEWSGCEGSSWRHATDSVRARHAEAAEALLASPALLRIIEDAAQRAD